MNLPVIWLHYCIIGRPKGEEADWSMEARVWVTGQAEGGHTYMMDDTYF